MTQSKNNLPAPALPAAPLALLCGDPSGVGPEIIHRWLESSEENRAGVVAVGPRSWLDTLPLPAAQQIAVGAANFKMTPGAPDVAGDAGQRVAWDALECGAGGCADGRFSAVVTGPVNKARLAKIGYPFPGQTEFFAARWSGEPVMAFAGGQMRVALATWHIPFCEVPAALTFAVLERTVAAAAHLARATCAVPQKNSQFPQIAVCGLNPHAGENGLLGADERDRLNPWLDALRPRFAGLSECLPADTVFYRHLRGEFDAVVALYHDQGLAPLKTLEFEQSVNLTLNLPHIRTSPDHGTAYPLAGKNTASTASFANAVLLARKLLTAMPVQ